MPLNPFEAQWKNIRSKRESVENAVSSAATALKKGKLALKKVSSLQAAHAKVHKELEKQAKVAAKSLTDANALRDRVASDLKAAEAKWTELKESAQKAGGQLADLRSRLLDSKLMAYSFSLPLDVTFNSLSGALYAKVDMGFGVKFGSAELEQLCQGNFKLPDVDPLEAVAECVGLQETVYGEYDKTRQKAFDKNSTSDVYFASKRFVDWAGPEQLAKTGLKCALMGGAGARDAALDALYMLDLEYDDILLWLKSHAPGEDAVDIAVAVVEAIASGQGIAAPKVTVDIEDVPYHHDFRLRGATEIPKAVLSKMGLTEGAISSLPDTHIGFSVVIPRMQPVATSLSLAGDRLIKGSNEEISFLAAIAQKGGPVIKNLMMLAALDGSATEVLSSALVKSVATSFAIDESIKKAIRKADTGYLNLVDSSMAVRMDALFTRIAVGNEASADIEELSLDTSTSRFALRAVLKCRHSWGTIRDALDALGKKVGNGVIQLEEMVSGAVADQLKSAAKLQQAASDAAASAQVRCKALGKQFSDAKAAVVKLGSSNKAVTDKLKLASSALKKSGEDVKKAMAAVAQLDAARKGVEAELGRVVQEWEKIKKWFEGWKPPIELPPPPFSIPRPRSPW